MTQDQVAANYSSLLDGVMTVSRSQSYFFLLLPRGTFMEFVIDGDEPNAGAQKFRCNGSARATLPAGRAKSARLLQNCEGDATGNRQAAIVKPRVC